MTLFGLPSTQEVSFMAVNGSLETGSGFSELDPQTVLHFLQGGQQQPSSGGLVNDKVIGAVPLANGAACSDFQTSSRLLPGVAPAQGYLKATFIHARDKLFVKLCCRL